MVLLKFSNVIQMFVGPVKTLFSENGVAPKIKILPDNMFFKKENGFVVMHVKMEDVFPVGSALRSIQLPNGRNISLKHKILVYILIYHWNKTCILNKFSLIFSICIKFYRK